MLIDKKLILEAKQKIGKQAALLIAEDLKLKNFDKNNLKASCPFHANDDTPSFLWNDKPDGLYYHCFGQCDRKYDLIDHFIAFYKMTYIDAIKKLFEIAEIEYIFGEQGIKTKPEREYHYPYPEGELGDSVIKYANLRHISEETLRQFDVGQDSHGNMVFNYYDTNDVLCMVKYRPSRKVEKGETKYWLQKEKGDDRDVFMPLLFGMNKIDITKSLLICEGELDSISIAESGFRNVTSVPNGASKYEWITETWDWLEQFEKIVLWFDNDKPGVETRKEVCARLGHWRTSFVNLPTTLKKDDKDIFVKDANDVLFHFGKEKVLDFINNAEEVPISNVIDLYDADDFDIETTPGLCTGLKNVNDIVYKFVYGSVIILTGQRGSGKSTFLNQTFICDAINQNENIYVFSGELGAPVLRNWIESTLLGRENIEMKNGFVRKFNIESKKNMREWYKGKIWMYDDMDNNANTIIDRGISITRKFGAKIWILDNITCMSLDEGSEKSIWEKQKDFIVRLVSLAKTYGILIVLVNHPRKLNGLSIERKLAADDVSGAGELTNLAQYVISVHRYTKKERKGEKNRKGEYYKGKEPILYDVMVEFLKNRYTGVLGEANLYFDYNSYRFYYTYKELWYRYGWCKDNSPLRTDDPNSHQEVPEWATD